MGRLAGLELHNFKSYKGTAKVGFGDASFASIIGPNGAGKSNMMDAISFVLGIQSSQLRSQNLKDLVYRGKLDNGIPDTSDPTSAYVSAVYQKDDGELMKLKRTINSNGTSDYKINEKNVTALQYTMALKAENVLVKAKNFLVFQGDIEQVASQSARDLSSLVETISGSAEYAKEYELLKEELERAHERSTEVFSRKRNLNSESKLYKEQMKEREVFETKLSEKYTLTKVLHLYKMFHNEKRHFQLMGEARRVKDLIASTKSKLADEEAALTTLTANLATELLASKKLESNIMEVRRAAEETSRTLIPVRLNKKSLENRIATTKKKINDLNRDLESQRTQEKALQKKLKEAKSLLESFEHQIEELNSSINILPEGLKEYEELRSKFLANSGSQLEETLAALNNDKDILTSTVKTYESQQLVASTKAQELTSEIQLTLGSVLADLKSTMDDLIGKRAARVQEKDSLLKQKEEAAFKELEINTDLKKTLVRLDELSSTQNESKKQKKLRDNVTMLRNLLKDGSIKGLMHELVRSSQQKYDHALQVALGRNFDAIVVESTVVAYKCIEILKERRAGTAMFIPLDSIVTEQINLNYLRSLDDQARPAIDVVEYDDPSIERAVQFVLSDTIIVDNIDVARELKWEASRTLSNKLISLDGSIIHKSGLMTGGQQEQKSSASLTWNKQEWNRLTKRKDELAEKLIKIQSERPKAIDIHNLTDAISQIDEELPLLRSKIASLERKINEREQEIKFHEDVIRGIDTEVAQKQNELSELQSSITDTEKKIEKLQQKVYSEFCSKHSLRTISEYEAFQGTALRARARKRAEFQRAISALTNQILFQNERITETSLRIEKLQQDLVSLQDDDRKTGEDLFTKSASLDELSAELEILQDDKEKQADQVSNISRGVKAKELDMKEAESELRGLTKELLISEELILKVDSERLNMLKNCKIENVDLPLEEGFLESISLGEDSLDISSAVYEIHIDYGLLDLRYQNQYSVKTEAELRVRIENVEKELQQLTPNTKAMERMKDVEQKLKEFDREFNKARQDERRSATRFNEVKQLRTELFMKAFTHISDRIDGVYKELTKSASSPLGGSAYLTLEEEDEPYAAGIKYHAMPPMKRFRDMELLSGGEKTMAALALLFAIHTFQPSPFFVLDEIDAALDNNNVQKIANYIKNQAGPGFQFIVISLKSTLFETSDALVGIYREQRENSSRTVSLDLRSYSEVPQDIQPHVEPSAVST